MTEQLNEKLKALLYGIGTFLVSEVLPWTLHTIGSVLTALVVAFCVWRFNKFLKKHENKVAHKGEGNE